MRINGLQKLTLLDFPGHTACTVFTSGCNFRCPFCHNASLVKCSGVDEISEEEFFSFLSKRKGILDGVAITGGEPTLQSDLDRFIEKIRAEGFKVKLDSNGYRPEVLRSLIEKGLVDYFAMDIKSSPENYSKVSGVEGIDLGKINESIDLLKSSGVPYEFRTTAVKGLHSPADFLAIGKWIGDVPNYFIQRFVDSGDVLGEGFAAFSKEEMTSLLAMARVRIPNAALRGVD